MCYILCMCVYVGASDTTTALLCAPGAFLGGSQGGAGMPPLGYAQCLGQRLKFFFLGGFCYF
jgi:hypothetical protein